LCSFGVSLLPKSAEVGFKLKLKFISLIYSEETVLLIMLTRKENFSPALSYLKTHLQKCRAKTGRGEVIRHMAIAPNPIFAVAVLSLLCL
jgi:hypothetical protein